MNHTHHHSTEEKTSVETSISNPPLLNSQRTTFQVTGMDCADEITAIQRSVKGPGIQNVSCSLMSSSVTIDHDPELSKESLAGMIKRAGVGVIDKKENKKDLHVDRSRINLVAASGITLGLGILLEWQKLGPEWLNVLLFVASVFTGGSLIFPKAIRSMKQKSLDMNVLMSVAVFGAFMIQQYSEAAAVVFLFSLSELLEALSVARARRAINEVLNLVPPSANVKDQKTGEFISIEVSLVKVGDVIQIKPGDQISLDGVIVSGNSFVNQAALTGESVPVKKSVDDKVYAGTLNQNGILEVKVTHDLQNTKASQIIHLIEEAQKQKAPSQRFVDQFAKIYTPTVFVMAILAAIIPPLFFGATWMDWIYKALVLLVIACPCALVLSTPVSIVSGLTALSRRGVLVKGGAFLESLGKLKAIALDKTGTLTEGKPSVQFSKLFLETDENALLIVAASLEKLSSHPIAQAVVEYSEKKSAKPVSVKNFNTLAGLGIEGEIEGHTYFIGNHKMAHELNVCTPELEALLVDLEKQAMTTVVIGHRPHDNCQGEVIGVLGLSDKIKQNSQKSIANLQKAGIKYIAVLSGDNQATTDAVARKVGIINAFGGLMPNDKVDAVKKMVSDYKYVGMVGDGINDAPALAQATVGIAMGAVGTDAAIETADIALMKDDLSQLSVAIEHGRRTRAIIQFNIAISIITKVIFLGLALTGQTNLWLAIAADTGVSLIVIVNALRLLKT